MLFSDETLIILTEGCNKSSLPHAVDKVLLLVLSPVCLPASSGPHLCLAGYWSVYAKDM